MIAILTIGAVKDEQVPDLTSLKRKCKGVYIYLKNTIRTNLHPRKVNFTVEKLTQFFEFGRKHLFFTHNRQLLTKLSIDDKNLIIIN